MLNDKDLETLANLPFDGNTTVESRRGSGPRREFIYSWLKANGVKPVEDEYGTIWVSKGKNGSPILYSSHMDIDMTSNKTGKVDFRVENSIYRGILDNAVGCYLNMLLAMHNLSGLHVFTASEEENPENTEEWARSARDVVEVLKRKSVKPALCVAVDVTYPRVLKDLEKMSDEEWDSLSADELFDQSDPTECYIDGMSSPIAEARAWEFVRQYSQAQSGNVKIRNPNLEGFDEAFIYREIAPSFAFGPVGFGGKYDLPDQRMPKRNVETALDFLRFVQEQPYSH